VSHWLLARLAEQGERSALIWRGCEHSRRQLLEEARRAAAALAAAGAGAGDSVAFVAELAPRPLGLLLALLGGRQVAVPLAAGALEREELLAAAGADFVAVDGEAAAGGAAAGRRERVGGEAAAGGDAGGRKETAGGEEAAGGDAGARQETVGGEAVGGDTAGGDAGGGEVADGDAAGGDAAGGAGGWSFRRRPAGPPPLPLAELRRAGRPGLVVLTSGSTGRSKAALHDLERLLEPHRERRTTWRAVALFSLDHIGGLNTLFAVLAGGGTLIAPGERTPDAVCRAIARERADLLPATPTFLNMLLASGAEREHDLSSLRLITYGAEPMPMHTLRALARRLPGVGCKQTYGMSELGILSTHSPGGESLWMRIGGAGCRIRVVDGMLQVRSPTAMLGYLNAPSPFDAEGWLPTGDLVEVDGDRVRIVGRASEVINVGGEKVFPAEVEEVLLALANVREATVYGRPNPVTGQIVAVRLSLLAAEAPEAFEERLREHCAARLAPYKVPLLVEIGGEPAASGRWKKLRRPSQEAG
jgi:acyl-CoA synthetase (AMP-forming)/AMP-acid ligase II